ncbi:MAG TPA: DUF1552 domain-containing protein [Vicinamibacterales bacterium]|jgi:hypothetical protein|nr:DUF1552 domain-containing protein [Vicinamibacterales bacterium]
MIVTKKHLPRRTFLKGAGTALIALPFMDAMIPALSAQAKRPFRFGAIYIPNGIYPQLWHPETTGSAFEFKQVMAPLEPFRSHLVTINGMKAPDGNPEMGGVHMGASAAWLNGFGPDSGQATYTVVKSRKSIDQYIADAVAEDTPLRSLQVGTEDMGTSAGACDGYPCVFFNAISWRDDTSPLPVAVNPRVTFERIFGEAGSNARRLATARRKQSLLDSVVEEATRMRKSLGPADGAILDEYLTNIRDVEQQLDRMDSRAAAVPEGAVAPLGLPDNVDDHLTVTYNLMLLAFQADVSRVFTFMVGHEGSGRSYAHIGIPEPHHPVSHHGDTAEGIAKYGKLTTYHVAKLAEFIEKLKATPDGDSTLLDRSLIYFGSGMGNGNAHDRNNPPVLMLGGANGKLKGNRSIKVENKEPTANLLLAMGEMAGSDVEKIGRSTGKLSL